MQQYDLSICVDCAMYLANGIDAFDDVSEARQKEIEAGEQHLNSDGWRVALDDDGNATEFSWSSCDCCKSVLAGNRVKAIHYSMGQEPAS